MSDRSVFYAPHADDESLAMGGSIARAVRLGHHVTLVLVTDSRPSERASRLYAGQMRCNLHDGDSHPYADVDLKETRWREFQAAGAALGVAQVDRAGIKEALGAFALEREIAMLMNGYEATAPRATNHHTVSGIRDPFKPDGPGWRAHPAHAACAAALALSVVAGARCYLHRVYCYALPLEARTADVIWETEPDDHAAKCRALDCYRRWQPPDWLAYGYHSVPQLFLAAAADPREFVDYL